MHFLFESLNSSKPGIPFYEMTANFWLRRRNAQIKQACNSTPGESRCEWLRYARMSHELMREHLRAAQERPNFRPDLRTLRERLEDSVLELCSQALAVDAEQVTEVIRKLTGGHEVFFPSSRLYSSEQLREVSAAFLRISRSDPSDTVHTLIDALSGKPH